MSPSWAGYALSAGVDTYFKARDQNAREEELQQVAQLRAMQAEKMRRELNDQKLSAEGAEELGSIAPSTITLAQGTPDTPPEVKTEDTGAPQDQQLGGIAPDASLGNAPSIMTATPGQQGQKPMTMTGLTEADAIKKLGAQKYAAMMRTPEGREALKNAGLITQSDIAVRQKRAQSMTEYRAMMKESKDLVGSGDVVGSIYKQAAALERLAETTDNEALQRYYEDRAIQLRDQARGVSQNEAEKKLLQEDMESMGKASENFVTNPGPQAYVDYLKAMRSNKSAIGQQRGLEMMGRIGLQQMEKYFANPAEQQFWSAVSKDMQDAHSLDIPGSIKRVLASMDPQVRAAILPSLIKSDVPEVKLALGLGSGPIKDAWSAANAIAIGKGLKPGTPEYAQMVMAKVEEYEKAKRAKEGSSERALLMKELLASERELAREFSDSGKMLKDMASIPPDQRREFLADRERTRIALRDLRAQIGKVSEGKINMLGDEGHQYDAAARRAAQTAKGLAGIKDGEDLKSPAAQEKIRRYNQEFKRLMEAEGLDPMQRPGSTAAVP